MMKVLDPRAISDAQLISSNLLEDDALPWSATLAYAVGNEVIFAHGVYRALRVSTGIQPTEGENSADWAYIGPTNLYAPFDNTAATAATASERISYVLRPGRADSLSLVGLDAVTARVRQMSAAGVTLFDQTFSLSQRPEVTTTWSAYFFGALRRVTAIDVRGRIVDGSSVWMIDIERPGGAVSVGQILIGMERELGEVKLGASIGIIDYSRKRVDEQGRAFLRQGAFANLLTASLTIPNSRLVEVRSVLEGLRARGALWSAASQQEALGGFFGVFRDFQIVIPYPTESTVEITIEGIA